MRVTTKCYRLNSSSFLQSTLDLLAFGGGRRRRRKHAASSYISDSFSLTAAFVLATERKKIGLTMKMAPGCFVVFLLFLPACQSAHGRYAHKLLKDLLTNYTNALRPVADTEHVINVTLQVTLSQIIDMDERNQILTTYLWVRQVWMDAFLAWKKDDYDGLDTIRIPSSYVWRPDIVLYNSADDEFSSSMETNVVLRHDGQVMWDQPAITKSSCSVDVAFFPFDVQECHLTFGSWTHNGNQMDLFNALDSADLADFIHNVEWEVLGMPAKKNVILYGCCSDPYPDITFTLHLKRRSSFYIFNLLLPCMMISFLAPLGFYLPADSGEKVSLGVTVLLALTVFQLLVAESMPPSESVPLIGKYYIATMTMVTASTALTIFIMNIHHCGPEGRPVPAWAERFILQYLARVCFVYEAAAAEERPPGGPASRERTESDGGKCNGEARGGDAGARKDETSVALDEGGDAADGRRSGGGAAENRKEPCSCHHHLGLRRNVEYIANVYQDQRAAQMRVGEWKKLAKVMDRFFMWLFFLMVFIMSVLILGKAV
ncbi:neuronal acetylcholine receptor subunit alpha-10-like [Hippocampus zosterae]|uniref:neuronal acetylcholine receptor subunit alpha-10-like n=1 Tax=Hippocampus zosterae TaxID=109293 RepID=UPI00223D9C68|nr:neuronal acetylcholine receptor subunit alpha-10-like [Hippocampus zosterae]